MINDLYPWPPTYAPTLGQPVPIAGAAPPAPAETDIIGGLARARRTKAAAGWPNARRTQDAAVARLVAPAEEIPDESEADA